MRSKRILLSTWAFPPDTSGSAIILYNLLRHLPHQDIVAVHSLTSAAPVVPQAPHLAIAARNVLLFGSPLWTLRCMRRTPRIMIAHLRRLIVKLAKRHRIERIYAHFPDPCFTIAAWQAARILGLPLTVYMDILWEESGIGPRGLAQEYEHRVLADAESRFAITDFAANYLERKHRLPFVTVPHVIDAAKRATGLQPIQAARPTIHFSGGIYARMNLDAVVRLVQAAQDSPKRPHLDICTPSLPRPLQKFPLTPRYLQPVALAQAQRQSDILYLPQAFESSHPLMIRNNFPTKAMEYLCAGRPILVHAPGDSYLAHLARQEGFGLVVDKPDTQALRAGIEQLLGDAQLQAQLVTQALRFVQTRDAKRWATKFWAAL